MAREQAEPFFEQASYDAASPIESSSRDSRSPIWEFHDAQELIENQSLHHSPTTSPEAINDVPHISSLPTYETLRKSFLADLQNYVAVGAIRLHGSTGEVSLRDECWMKGLSIEDRPFPDPSITWMLEKGWMQTRLVGNTLHPGHASLQVFIVAEDVGRRFRLGSTLEFRRLVKYVFNYIDASEAVWNGNYDPQSPIKLHSMSRKNDESLFYIFNTLASPSPHLPGIQDVHAQRAVEDILYANVQGLQTPLYPYQTRSAASMLQRESQPKRSPDPRKPMHCSPLGEAFYLDRQDGILLKEPHLYEEPRGGILAETMGYGKTLICLAAILATRGHFPSVPEDRLESKKDVRPRTASLMLMAAAKASRSAIPWKAEFHSLSKLGYHYEKCTDELKKQVQEYEEPIFTPSTPSRKGKRQASKVVKLCSATLVIVPPNLLVQWQLEISKHVEPGALDVLVVDHSMKLIPSCTELVKYDVILITKARFEQEYRDNDLHTGKRGKGAEVFKSPLTEVRWLRVICDEGHSFAGSGGSRTNAMAMLDKMYIERRWVVSGTPSNSLLGVEVGLAANETGSDVQSQTNNAHFALQARRTSNAMDNESKDLEQLKLIVVNFLRVQPWANARGSDHANWKKYFSAFNLPGQREKAACLRTLLQSLVVRHRIQDIDVDLSLPPLENKVVYLEPSFYDKLSINLFLTVLASNAVTSERTDEDYMFHAKNRKQLDLLINNLRQSSFHWVGFKEVDILEPLRISRLYLEDNNGRISENDSALLQEAIAIGERAATDSGWRAFSTLHEIGVFIEGFPADASEAWALHGQVTRPLLLGTVQARNAQQYVEEHLTEDDPAEGIVGAGLRAMQAARRRAADEDENKPKSRAGGTLLEEPKLKDQTTTARVRSNHLSASLSKKCTRFDSGPLRLKPESDLAQAQIVGFSSAKLAYLVDRVLELQSSEKIIIFYDANNVAFWIAEALELLSVKFLIYSNTLTVARRATYLATFNQNDDFRVLLMDLKQAAHGLHVACASRVFIVSPIWQPSIESQAIKRAHRIGQTKSVYVETLVLKDTLEDRMLKRRKQMSNQELQRAERSLLDDGTMNQIIKDEVFIPFKPEDLDPARHVAKLAVPQALFGRSSRAVGTESPDEGLVLAAGDVLAASMKDQARKRRAASSTAESSRKKSSQSSKKPEEGYDD